MDCRNSLLLGLCLLGAASGCNLTQQQTVPGGSASAMMGGQDARLAQAPKPKPTAKLWVAYGNLCENSAAQAQTEPVRRQKLLEEARRSYQKAIEIEPSVKDGYVALGRYYQGGEDLPRALETYQKGLKRLPKDAILWSELAFCQCRKKDWAAAVESFRKAQEQDPENREYGTQLGLCLARAGRVDEAVACLSKVQGPAQAYYNVARMMERLNRPDQSKAYLRMALQLKPDLSGAQEMLAQLEAPADANRGGGVVNIGFQQATP